MAKISSLIIVLLASAWIHAGGNHGMPDNAKPLSEVIRAVEAKGYTMIHDVSLDHGKWECEVMKDGKQFDVIVDPMTAEILSVREDRDD